VKLQTPLEEVLTWNDQGRLWASPRELVTRLHTFLSAKQNDKIEQTLLGQYKLAKQKKKIGWMKEFRACVSLHQSDKWMKENIDYRPPTRRQQTRAIPSCTMTKDVRLGTDPSLQVLGHVGVAFIERRLSLLILFIIYYIA
jgi:hypothetical protein